VSAIVVQGGGQGIYPKPHPSIDGMLRANYGRWRSILCTTAPDGDAEPFLGAAKGSWAINVEASDDAKNLYIKVDEGGDNDDWVLVDVFTGTLAGTLTIGEDDAGHDVIFYGDTANANMTWDTSADDLLLNGAARLVLQTAHSGTLLGAGASGAAHALGSTADNALEFYLDGTHTSGDMRGMYLRMYFSGTGGSGEAARIFSTINNKTVATGGTVNGAHISMGTAGASAAVSGAANALRATFGIAAASTDIGGTCAVIQVDTDFDTAVTVPADFAFLRLTNTNTKKSNNFLRLPNVAAEAGGLFCAHTTQTMTHSIKIVSEDGTDYYVMCTDANTNRTEA